MPQKYNLFFIISKILTITIVLFSCWMLTINSNVALAGWKPEVDIPFKDESSITGKDQTLPDYVNRVYKFVSMSIGILGAAMFMIGGFQYLVSAGNTAAAAEAKKTMFAALAGIVIVLLAYLLLRIVNKELVELKNPGAEITSGK